MQWKAIHLRAVDQQQTDNLRVITRRRVDSTLRAVSVLRMGVHPRAVDKQKMDDRVLHKSLELVEKREKLPQVLEVEKTSKGPMETNIDPHLQEEEATTGPIEKLIEVQLDPSKPS